jgi:hypothetical protein
MHITYTLILYGGCRSIFSIEILTYNFEILNHDRIININSFYRVKLINKIINN